MYNIQAAVAELNDEPLPTIPAADPDEYRALSAYARYRILLLHLVQGSPQAAAVVYDTLQDLHPAGSVGYPFAEIASILKSEFDDSGSLPAACLLVADYVEAHPEILEPLGNSGYHGGQAHEYLPEDVCPVK